MKKKGISVFLLLCLIIQLLVPVKCEAASKSYMAGITLDVSNRYYSVKEIEQYISLASGSKRGYVQLHFSGDRNLGVECSYLKQTATKKYCKNGGEFYNPSTGKSFLSKKQISSILKFAKKKNVEIVPEIDMPGHMGGFYKLYVKAYGKKSAKNIFNDDYDGELRIGNKNAIAFAKKIYSEYATLFKGCKYFHIGCDEFWSRSCKANAGYINTISKYMQNKGFSVWAWNDLFEKKNISSINKKIWVTYWSYDGDASSKKVKNERRKKRASFPELQKAGFRIINYNSYYLYYCPTRGNTTDATAEYIKNDAKKNWSLTFWDSDSGTRTKSGKGIVGAAVSIWGEDSAGAKNSKIYSTVKGLYIVVIKKTHSAR